MPIPAGSNPSISLAASFVTIPTSINRLDNIAYQINITTSNSVGTFTMQCSSDQVNWANVGTAASVAAANDVAVVWVNQEYCSHYVRLSYTANTAGTGTCTIILTAKDIGA